VFIVDAVVVDGWLEEVGVLFQPAVWWGLTNKDEGEGGEECGA